MYPFGPLIACTPYAWWSQSTALGRRCLNLPANRKQQCRVLLGSTLTIACMHGACTLGSPSGLTASISPILPVNYPSVEWLDHFATAPSKIINRVVGEYHLFAVGVRFEREGAVHYWGSANAVPRNRFSTDFKASIFDFDQQLLETADAAANSAIKRVISIISTQR